MQTKSLRSRAPQMCLAAALIVLGLATGLGAHALADTDDIVYHACVNNKSGNIKMVSESASCANNETLIVWNQQGPEGPKGEPGMNANLSASELQSIKCTASPEPRVDLFGCDLIGADFSDTDLERADLSNALFFGNEYGIVSNFSRSNLRRADLSGADLVYTNMSDANLVYADLSRAYMHATTLRNANLFGANLINADLVDANLENANLTNANLSNAYLGTANLVNADLTNATLTNVIWNYTVCPDGSNSDDNGGTCLGHLN